MHFWENQWIKFGSREVCDKIHVHVYYWMVYVANVAKLLI